MYILTLADVKAIEKQLQGIRPDQPVNSIELDTRMIAKACEISYEELLDLPMDKLSEYQERTSEQVYAPVEMVHTEEGWRFTMAFPPSEGECCIEVRFPTRRDTVKAQSQSTPSFIANLLAATATVDGNKRPISYWNKISYTDYFKIMETLFAYGL